MVSRAGPYLERSSATSFHRLTSSAKDLPPAVRRLIRQAATAARELLEETGIVAVESLLLRQIWPDSGLSGDAVNVVIVRIDPRADRANAEYSTLRWIDVGRISQEIADNQIGDGISISTLALAWAKSELCTAAAIPEVQQSPCPESPPVSAPKSNVQ